jgi:outer membrane biosynthesis protein TonB
MLRTALLALALTTALVTPAFADSPPAVVATASQTVFLKAVVHVDAAGHITALDWGTYQGLQAKVARELDTIVRTWEFVPGTVNGVAMDTRSELHVMVRADALPDGTATLTVTEAKTGPGGSFDLIPRAPIEAMRGSDDAIVDLTYAVDTDGRATVTSLDVRATGNKRAFEAAIRAAVRGWRFVPESVGGRAQAATGKLKYKMCIETCTIKSPPGWWDENKLDSALALKTDVRGLRI